MPAAETIFKPACAAKVLIVEDEGLIARDIEMQLRKTGYTVMGPCASGEDVLRAIAENEPELVLMDIRIKGEIDGIETARRMQERYDIPVIFLTAHSDADTVQRAKLTGPFGYLSKPFQPRSLATSIEIALHKHRAERDLRQQRTWLATLLGTISDGVIVTDEHGNVQFMNSVAEGLTGWPVSEARNQPAHTVLPIRDLAADLELDDLVPHTILHKRPATIPTGLHAVSRTNRVFPVEGELAPSPDGLIGGGCILTFRDVSERLNEEQDTIDVLVTRDSLQGQALNETIVEQLKKGIVN